MIGTEPPHEPLLSVRAAVVFLLAILSGLGAGVLAHIAEHNVAESILTGSAATATALLVFNQLIARD